MLTYNEAVTGTDRDEWKKAIEAEKDSFEKNKTWELVDASTVGNKKPLSSKWVFTNKGTGKFKARLVIRGCLQKYGIDYNETFSPVVSANSLRILIALPAKRDYTMYTLDIKTAFLYVST